MKLVLVAEDRRHKDLDVFILPTLTGSYCNHKEYKIKAFGIGITWIWFTFGICLLWGKTIGMFGIYNNFE